MARAKKQRKKYTTISLIVEDEHCDAYKVLIEKITPEVRGYPRRKNKTIPATRKLRAWIQEEQDKYDFVFVLVDLDTPMHRKDKSYFGDLARICKDEGAILLIVKREVESWILADVCCLARWKKKKCSLPTYSNTARNPHDPKKEIAALIQKNGLIRVPKRNRFRLDPKWLGEIAKNIVINEETLKKNSSLRCFYDLVKGCCGSNGQEYFDNYPHKAHCNSPKIPD